MLFQDDLLAELEELEQEELDKNLLEIGDNVPLPNVPSSSLPARPGIKHKNTRAHTTHAHAHARAHAHAHFGILGTLKALKYHA